MGFKINSIFFYLFSLLFLPNIQVAQSMSKFKVVLDAGHGGKDYGAVYHGNIEKNIALKTVLKVGEILVYTRKSDVFIELQQRANIANKSRGSIFVSMHCNANKNQTPSGNETYVMGITRNVSNLEVAKMENEVVTQEADYKIKYDGYDPNAPESVIGISILQEEYLDQSIELAGRVQQFFTKKTSNKDRGVKQAGFLVLRQITMPRVLIEMGFVSNKEEGAFLNSEQGQEKLAEAIAEAILDYKNEFFIAATSEQVVEDKAAVVVSDNKNKVNNNASKQTDKINNQEIIFKVQIASSKEKLSVKPSNFKGLDNITVEKVGLIYKYF